MQESLGHAKKAVALDLKDCKSWTCLGNAHLTKYFSGSKSELKELHSALKAYSQASRAEGAATDPDLHFNQVYNWRNRDNNKSLNT